MLKTNVPVKRHNEKECEKIHTYICIYTHTHTTESLGFTPEMNTTL